jgi:Putative zincin peptidase
MKKLDLSLYKKEEVVFTIEQIQKPLLWMTALSTVIIFAVYELAWGISYWEDWKPYVWLFILYFAMIVVHELLHGIGFLLFGKVSWSNIHFGVNWKALMPYAHCEIPISISAYRGALMLPIVITGIMPLLIGLFIGNGFLTVLGTLHTHAGFGDVLIMWALRTYRRNTIVKDHPEKIGCEVFLPQV